MHSFSFAILLVPLVVAPLAAQYSTGFETFAASAAGVPAAGQDGFYVPAVAGSIDANIYTYAGNPFALPANPTGGANFHAGLAATGAAARSQRAVGLPVAGRVAVDFDVCAHWTLTTAPVNNIGSFSYQPSTTNVYVNLLARWPTGTVFPPAVWNADLVVGPTATGTQTVLADPAFQGLAVDVWHRWGCTADFATGEYVEFRITNGSTGVTTVFTPAPGTMPLPGQGTPLPTDFRLFTGAAGNVFAVDNLAIRYLGTYDTFGSGGCAGSLGVPTLAASSGSRPALGTTLSVVLGNLPLNLAIVATGFSNTAAFGGTVPLPFDMTGLGFPGCHLLVDPLVSDFLVGAANTAVWNLAVPANNALSGVLLFNQGVSLDTGSPALAMTNGGRAVIGE
jgi:hypothetical protein